MITSSFNSKEESTIKDGLYKAIISTSYKQNGVGLPDIRFKDEVEIKLENSRIVFISLCRHNRNNLYQNRLLNKEMSINQNGDAVAETIAYEQSIRIKNSEGNLFNYKVLIKKENLK